MPDGQNTVLRLQDEWFARRRAHEQQTGSGARGGTQVGNYGVTWLIGTRGLKLGIGSAQRDEVIAIGQTRSDYEFQWITGQQTRASRTGTQRLRR